MNWTDDKKEERLHIRTLPRRKHPMAKAPEKMSREEEVEVIKLSTADFDKLMRELEEPPRDRPALRRLLNEAAIWNS